MRFIGSFCITFGRGTNNEANIQEAIFVMTWALEMGYRKILLEEDSILLVEWIMQKSKPQ